MFWFLAGGVAGAAFVPIGHIPITVVTIIIIVEATKGMWVEMLKLAVGLFWGAAVEKGKFTLRVSKLCSDRCKVCCVGDIGIDKATNSGLIGFGGEG